MKFLRYMKDGGPLSKSQGYFLVELKKLFTIVLLKFDDGSREAYHTHAFNAASWVIRGKLVEEELNGRVTNYLPSFKTIFTSRNRFHKVSSVGTTWALSFRGPWADKWKEYLPEDKCFITLTHGRKVVDRHFYV